MFRDFTQRTARKLSLAGFVRNLPDGTVEVVAQGDRASLEKFTEALRRGSLLSRIDSVETTLRDPINKAKDFRITY
jgi:acylphosphatase